MNGVTLSLSKYKLLFRVEKRQIDLIIVATNRMAYDRVLRKLTVCRHWTLDRLSARGTDRTLVRFDTNPSGHRPKILACLYVLELLENISCNFAKLKGKLRLRTVKFWYDIHSGLIISRSCSSHHSSSSF
ncbi:unnamed protein product [Pieris brassicae]|uniref:Uncharacterized protein n=1 Tax=Pieris brassicae TaxID=7116 RepID=A0A9P0SDM0_PIEBR|nr:unnamed protein product [Pieris brassicae]